MTKATAIKNTMARYRQNLFTCFLGESHARVERPIEYLGLARHDCSKMKNQLFARLRQFLHFGTIDKGSFFTASNTSVHRDRQLTS